MGSARKPGASHSEPQRGCSQDSTTTYYIGSRYSMSLRIRSLPRPGCRPGYVARQMGHSSMVTTLSFYGHWFSKSDRRHVERMEGVRTTAVDDALLVHDDARLPLDSEVNEDSWHRFGTNSDHLDMGAVEVIDLSGAEGGTRSGGPRESLVSRRVRHCLSRLRSAWGVTWSDTKVAQLSLGVLLFYSRSSDPMSGFSPKPV